MTTPPDELRLTVDVDAVATELFYRVAAAATLMDCLGRQAEPYLSAYAGGMVDLVTEDGWALLQALSAAVAAKEREEGS